MTDFAYLNDINDTIEVLTEVTNFWLVSAFVVAMTNRPFYRYGGHIELI